MNETAHIPPKGASLNARTISLAHRTMIDLSPPEVVRVAARAGFDAVGFPLVPVRDDEPAWRLLEDPRVFAETKAALDAHGVDVLDVELVRIEPQTRARDYRSMFEMGARLGAHFVVAIAIDDDASRITAHLSELCTEAEPFGLRVALEFMARWGINTLARARRIVEAAHPDACLLVDAAHFFQCGATVAELAGVDPRRMPYMQINDARREPWHKVLCGDGALPLPELMAALPPDIPVSLEVSGPAPEKRDAERYAKRAAQTNRATVG
jgi:sugar phosphate isomerase/epimerase